MAAALLIESLALSLETTLVAIRASDEIEVDLITGLDAAS